MSELKTLEDLQWPVESGTFAEFAKIRELKQEAIKWVKDARNKDYKNWYIRCEIIIIFFNITGEDLQ